MLIHLGETTASEIVLKVALRILISNNIPLTHVSEHSTPTLTFHLAGRTEHIQALIYFTATGSLLYAAMHKISLVYTVHHEEDIPYTSKLAQQETTQSNVHTYLQYQKCSFLDRRYTSSRLSHMDIV